MPPAVSVGGQSVKIGTGRDALAVIDTGTTLIGGPTTDVRAIWDTVSGAAPSREIQGFFEFRASHSSLLPPLQLGSLNLTCSIM